jgi:pyrimidine-nucleoside phosphorylase
VQPVELISKKRDGGEFTSEEIDWFVRGYTSGEIPDYQASAWLMAVYLKGMSEIETRDLTLSMARSGKMLDLSDAAAMVVDKHSTGGVGDKVSLVIAPLVASCGLPVAKMTGRGLGFTGGTVDKLESIPGYRTDLNEAEFKDQLRRIGIVLSGQASDLAPADGRLYALRDVTATVESIPLIVSSIMSKKLAAGANAIVLDVKTGRGAFMKTQEAAAELASAMVRLGRQVGRHVVALISDMNQPLGWAVGNTLEVREAIATLQGSGPMDFREHCLAVAAEMLLLGERVESLEQGVEVAEAALARGEAWHKFRQLVEAQGGDVRYVDEPDRLPTARLMERVAAPHGGYLASVEAAEIGLAVAQLGGGRERKGDPIDHAVGVVVHYKVGDWVGKGSALFTVHAADEHTLEAVRERLLAAHTLTAAKVSPLPLFHERIA